MPVLLRTGTAEDASACTRVWERSIVARDGEPPADLAHVARRLSTGGGRLRVGADGEAVLGFALALRAGADVLLSHIAVLPTAQRRGLAGRLLADAVEHAREHRAGRLLLEVRTGNHGAVALYEGLGFRAARAPVPHPLGGYPMQLLSLDLR
jgi:ribosomal protein S18 acetylase RimI-like enzyme